MTRPAESDSVFSQKCIQQLRRKEDKFTYENKFKTLDMMDVSFCKFTRPHLQNETQTPLTRSALVHGGEALQYEGLGGCGGLGDGEGGDAHRSGLDGGFGAQDGAGL